MSILNYIKLNYKSVIIPQNTILYRKFKDDKIYPSMYFGFDNHDAIYSSCSEHSTQIWRLKKDIYSTLVVKKLEKDYNGCYTSDILNLYLEFDNKINHEDYVFLKSGANPNRFKFIDFLRKNGVKSWVSNVQNHSKSMELFLFEENNSEYIEFISLQNSNERNNTFSSVLGV
jgi:hypothetical protein